MTMITNSSSVPVDVAYFVGTGIDGQPGEAAERAIVDAYARALASRGVDADGEELWRSYRLGSASGYVMAVIASQLVVRTERGDRMFTAMARRSAAMARRLRLAELVEAP
jgi:hypothetical protein